ncbi:MAG TPA: hypothetical protein PLZ42_03695 [Methanothrix sp.]|nr:hypothetical protein [Methanothrix sp.]
MRCLICLAVALLALAPMALGAVGLVEQSGGSASADLASSYYVEAPALKGPYDEGFSPTELDFGTPEMYTFAPPDDGLSFVSATPPESVQTGMEGTSATASVSWYWPGSVESQNKLYIQTPSGVATVAGCGNGGHLPLWAKVAYTGNFFVYEWYPNQLTPTVNWHFWTWPNYLKGWFRGDDAGWHIICFHCDKSSNYVYIYVFPDSGSQAGGAYGTHSGGIPGYYDGGSGSYAGGLSSYADGAPGPYAGEMSGYYEGTSGSYAGTGTTTGCPRIEAPQTVPTITSLAGDGLSAGLGMSTPTPPDPVSEGLMPTDLRLPAPECITSPGGHQGDSCTSGGGYATCGTTSPCGVSSGGSTGYCWGGTGTITPPGFNEEITYTVSDFGLVYTPMAACRHNEYYVQTWPNRLTTVASTQKDEWLPLWSKISRPGMYWSFEWPPCKSGCYCQPEVKSLGYKKEGWYPTWFKSSTPGWHLLCYQCNDWSNYVYIYVWPFDC